MAVPDPKPRRAAVDASVSSVLLNCQSWDDVHLALAEASEDIKGRTFELLVQGYLRIDSKYDFRNVWSTHGDLPRPVLKKLNLFSRDVTGIDLVAESRNGKYWAVQCKYHQDEKWSLSRKEATGLIAGRNRAHGEFELGLICTTANSRSTNLGGEPDLEYLMGDVWRGLGAEFFHRLHVHLEGATPPPPSKKTPRPHQQEALDGIVQYFTGHSRGKVVMPCATGKSLVGFWLAARLRARRVLVAVPNLSLVRQLLRDWTEQSLAHGLKPHWVVVCSDDSVADSVAAKDLGVKVDTEASDVADWLRSDHQRTDLSVVFTTYQSGRVLSDAARQASVEFDLGIFDEAHRTAGREGAPFAHLLSEDNVRVNRRVYMTATPRIYKGKSREDVISMSDPALYGGNAFKMTFLEAMDRGIIPNLTIVAVTVSENEVEKLLRDRLFVRLQAEHEDEVVRAEDLVSALAVRKAMKKYGIRRILGFYSSKRRCRLAREVQQLVSRLFPDYGPLDIFHVDGEMTSAERDSELRAFATSDRALLTNVRIFVEGVDCPSMDAVIFADPRQSTIDIVQGIGRALRPFHGKDTGYAIIPTIIESDGTPSDSAYEQVVRVASALGSENEVILDYFAAIAQRRPWGGRRVFEVMGDAEVGRSVDLEEINRAVAVRTYERTVEWQDFAAARKHVHSLELGSVAEWRRYLMSEDKPPDIPNHPERIYASSGWQGFGDWLGTGRVADRLKEHRSFRLARAYVRRLRLTSTGQWLAFARSAERPADVPATPHTVYRGLGWRSMGDWLGTGTVATRGREYRPFQQARAFLHTLGLTSREEWFSYCQSGGKPADIPANPHRTYAPEWKGMRDWLGAEPVSRRLTYRPFVEARLFARSLELSGSEEWFRYCKGLISGKKRKPKDIPAAPHNIYHHRGWRNWGDWLGTGVVAPHLRSYLAFREAREFVRALHLRSQREWVSYCKGAIPTLPPKPGGIPRSPEKVYKDDGWVGLRDWLGADASSVASHQVTDGRR